MGQGRLMHWIVCRIVLFALAIQGLTADREDLASINALRQLCLMPAEFDLLDFGDEWPDDVCEATGAETNSVMFAKSERHLASSASFCAHDLLKRRFEQSARMGAHASPFSAGVNLSRSLCRMLC
jgi:hypothetical protein